MTRYLRVRLENDKRYMLEVISENKQFISGWQLDNNGDRQAIQHIIEKTAIKSMTEYRMNLTYCELEKVTR